MINLYLTGFTIMNKYISEIYLHLHHILGDYRLFLNNNYVPKNIEMLNFDFLNK